jgi:PPM family protein phosphatase
MDELLSIGDFSGRCGLSAKMLRSYAASGLLVPAAVDDSSGYRYYSTGQLHQARVIVLLRRAGIPIDDILEFFKHPDAAQLDRWDRQIVRDSTTRRHALVQTRAVLAMDQAPPPTQPDAPRKGAEVTHTFVTGTATHRGGRDTNEDAVLVGDGLFAVADGVGGLQDGEVASRLALDTLEVAFAADPTVSGLLDACQEANRAVWGQANGQDNIMGTTLAAFAMTSDAAGIVLHAGDSRLYRLRHGRLEQLTHDHTVIADLMRAGELSEEDARTHPHRFVLTRAIGVFPNVDIDHAGVSCEPGDRLLLCSDGLFKALAPDELKAAMASEVAPQRSADQLITRAVEREAEDNVTAMIIDIR